MMPKAKSFVFQNYNYERKNLKISFFYRIDFRNQKSLNFTETVFLPKPRQELKSSDLQRFLEPLHLILGVSYYKLYCPPEIKIPYEFSKEQAEFWNKVYKKGLGEFLYRNNINPKKLAKFPYSKVSTSIQVSIKTENRVLLGIGGGKDSIVAGQLLKDLDFISFIVETGRSNTVQESVARALNRPVQKIKRVLDPKIFKNHEGAYNGHIPISAIYAFLGLSAAALGKYRYVIVANEHSSNFGNIIYRGLEINHQWSKSAEFEEMLQDYTRKFITRDIIYFSLLRQFYEIRVAQTFAKSKIFFPLFTSCNRYFRIHSNNKSTSLWCGECPKCVFTFLILSPFIPKKELIAIFSKNLYAQKNLLRDFKDVLGYGKLKPFDCVGTFEEARAAFIIASKKYQKDFIIKSLHSKVKISGKSLSSVFKTNKPFTLPTPFRFLGINNVCIVGYGREGRVTEKYLRKNYPHLQIGIIDKKQGKNYLEKLSRYDLAVKTPGIPKEKISIPYVTATNIFFSQNNNFKIGVTGTKGKSTTASLIYEMLKAAGKKARFLGNIGNPMLGVLLGKIDKKEIFVIELSSYMLDDIEYSPNLALLLNLFPEHMNYHQGVPNYYRAKKKIFEHQRAGDWSVVPPFIARIPVSMSEIKLKGNHNLQNIKAALAVAKLLKLPDAAIKKAIKKFKPLSHRLQYLGNFKGIQFYDDAISTTPESTIMALKTLKNIGTIFLGGEDRGYDFRALEKFLRNKKIRNIVLFPGSGNRILKNSRGFNILKTRSMKSAVDFAFRHTPKGKICLLSTASPSYSLWKNFEEKGDEFKKYVFSRG